MAAGVVPAAARSEPVTAGTKFVYFLWFIILADPQWLIASVGPTFILKGPTVLFGLTLLLICIKPPESWFPPLLVFIIYTLVNSYIFAFDRGASFNVAKQLVAYYVLAISTLAFVRNVRYAVPIVSAALMWQYVWWVGWGVKSGLVDWQPNLANYDAFGPLMAIGLGVCYHYALATSNRKERWIAFATALGCVVGLVSSYARGAVLGAAVVVGWIWVRSKKKGRATLVVGCGLLLAAGAAAFFNGADRGDADSNFFVEMGTIGSGDATQNDRAVIWALARREFYANALFGVGAENFGAYAAESFAAGTINDSYYDENPGRLYGKQLHSTYFQILAEYGAIGSIIFLWMLYDFRRRNILLRTQPHVDRWFAVSGGRLDLVHLSYALEIGMVGFLATGLFYNEFFEANWFYTLTIINTLLSYLSKPPGKPSFQRGHQQASVGPI